MIEEYSRRFSFRRFSDSAYHQIITIGPMNSKFLPIKGQLARAVDLNEPVGR